MSREIQSGGIWLVSVIHFTRKAWSICAWLKFHHSPGYSVTTSTQGPNWFPLINRSLSQHDQLTRSTAHQSRLRTHKTFSLQLVFIHFLNSFSSAAAVTCYCLLLSSWCSVSFVIQQRSNTARVLVPGRVIVPYRRTEKDTKITSKWSLNKAPLPLLQRVRVCVIVFKAGMRKKKELQTASLQKEMYHPAQIDWWR